MSLDTATNTASFTPGSNLTPGIVCTATLTTDIKSSAGTALAADYVWTFTTGPVADVTAPTVVSISPVDTDIGVLLDQNITTTFDEALDPSTVDVISFTLTADAGATVIAGSVSYANLVASTLYTATLTTAITDPVVPANALAADVVWSFTTGTAVATGPNLMEQQGRPLPLHVKIEFNDFLKCGRLEYGFIRVQCTSCHKQEPLREYRVSANQKPRARQNYVSWSTRNAPTIMIAEKAADVILGEKGN